MKITTNRKEQHRIDTLQPFKVNSKGKVERNKEYTKHYGGVEQHRKVDMGSKQETYIRESGERQKYNQTPEYKRKTKIYL